MRPLFPELSWTKSVCFLNSLLILYQITNNQQSIKLPVYASEINSRAHSKRISHLNIYQRKMICIKTTFALVFDDIRAF